MKNEIQAMSLRKIKWMMAIRWISLFLAVLFVILTIALSLGRLLMHWSGVGSILVVVTCVILSWASWVEYLVLKKRLASGGL